MIQQLAYTLALLFMGGAVPFMIREPDEAFRPRWRLALLWAICGIIIIGHLSAWGVSK